MQEAPGFPVLIVGLGQMGSALVKGVLRSTPQADGLVFGHDQDPSKLKALYPLGLKGVEDLSACLSKIKTLFLALKPHHVLSWLRSNQKRLDARVVVVSVAAGIPLKALREALKDKGRVARLMPNLAIEKGVCPLGMSFETTFPQERKTEVLRILSRMGDPLELDEEQIDTLTALSGSGIAFVWHVLEGFIEAGVKLGLPFSVSRKVAVETFLGAGILAKEDKEVPIPVLKERVSTPKGTTIEGLFALERLALKGIMIEAITKAYERAQSLSPTQEGV